MILRAFVVWLILIIVESVHGIFRRLVVEPWIGDFTARQVSVATGAALILIVAYLFIFWIDPRTSRQLMIVGMIWVVPTLAFEIGIGRFALNYPWERVLSDFNLAKGGLLGIGMLIMGLAPWFTWTCRRIRASRSERARSLPGDERIRMPIASLTNAITIRCSAEELWPWLAQMGAGRAGWYSYDLLDNGGRRSAERILPEFQKVAAGTLFPALPGATDGFFVLGCEQPRFLVLGVHSATWTFLLERLGTEATRLIVRVRVNTGYRFHGLPLGLVKLIHLVMQRKQLLELARRGERVSGFTKLVTAKWQTSPSAP